jgi:hypothetical protein
VLLRPVQDHIAKRAEIAIMVCGAPLRNDPFPGCPRKSAATDSKGLLQTVEHLFPAVSEEGDVEIEYRLELLIKQLVRRCDSAIIEVVQQDFDIMRWVRGISAKVFVTLVCVAVLLTSGPSCPAQAGAEKVLVHETLIEISLM